MLRRYGWKPDLPDPRDRTFKIVAKVAAPTKVDLRDKMPAVYNQLDLGSCTANALGAAFEYNQIIQGVPHWTPSRLMLYYLEREMEGTIKEDAGAFIRDGCKVLAKFGVCPETMWPYNTAKFAKKPLVKCYKTAERNQLLRYARVPMDPGSVESTFASGYPITFGMNIYPSFETPEAAKTGLIPLPVPGEKSLGGHAVLAVGYNRKKNQIIVRNSWGDGWGDKGYFYLPYDYFFDPKETRDFWALYTVEDGDAEDGE